MRLFVCSQMAGLSTEQYNIAGTTKHVQCDRHIKNTRI